MIAGFTRQGKKIYQVWKIEKCQHQLILGERGFSCQDHKDAYMHFRKLAMRELATRGRTEFYQQFTRLADMHKIYLNLPMHHEGGFAGK